MNSGADKVAQSVVRKKLRRDQLFCVAAGGEETETGPLSFISADWGTGAVHCKPFADFLQVESSVVFAQFGEDDALIASGLLANSCRRLRLQEAD
jgi:hypothetical protein